MKESYEKMQRQCGLKPGYRVSIVPTSAKIINDLWPNYWNPCMNETFGKEGIIKKILNQGVWVEIIETGEEWVYPYFVLRKCESQINGSPGGALDRTPLHGLGRVYRDAQRTSPLNVGDSVLVLSGIDDYIGCWAGDWDEVRKHVGKVGRIVDITPFGMDVELREGVFPFPYFLLERYELVEG